MAAHAPLTMESKQSLVSLIAAFALDTAIVYILALRVSGLLVSLWFVWIAPLLQISVNTPPGDWYLQHLEWVTIIPAFAAGYINLGRVIPATFGKLIDDSRSARMALWAWILPTVVLIYKMLRYHSPSSVLYDSSTSAIGYFFDIQHVMPNRDNFLAIDSVRVLAQMTITAPFYAGIAYYLGALSSKHGIMAKLFSFGRPEETPLTDEGEQTTPTPLSSSAD
jgi:hypothetical protein